MDHESHIFLVDTKTKGYGCNDDVDLISHPSHLDLLPILITHLGMIEIAFDIITAKLPAQLLAFLP